MKNVGNPHTLNNSEFKFQIFEIYLLLNRPNFNIFMLHNLKLYGYMV